MTLKKIAIVFGIVFVAAGLLGFLPAANPGGKLLGLFAVNSMHNLIHLATGIVALVVGFASDKASRIFFQVFGANTFREFLEMLGPNPEPVGEDDSIVRMRAMPTTVVSSTLEGPFDWPNATVVGGDGVDVVARLKEESDVPLRSHGSLALNWSLMAAGLVDLVQVTLFPVISGTTGTDPIFGGAADFDLELVESRTLDGRTQELTYRPTIH